MPIVYDRHKPVSSVKKYRITSFNYESSGRISVRVQGKSCDYNLKFYPKVIYRNPVTPPLYNSVVQWHTGNNLYKLFTDITFQSIIVMLDSQP